MSKDKFQTNYTAENARKIQQLNHPERVHVKILVNNATDEEVERFIQENSQPKRRRVVWNRRWLGLAKKVNRNLAKGKVQFMGDKMFNPIKLDLSGLKPKEV